jgi:hypothetical protein
MWEERRQWSENFTVMLLEFTDQETNKELAENNHMASSARSIGLQKTVVYYSETTTKFLCFDFLLLLSTVD